MHYWAEIRNDFFETKESFFPEDGDLLARVSIDAWKANYEQGQVIACVMLTNHGDIVTDYRDGVARIDEAAQEAIRGARDMLQSYFQKYQQQDQLKEAEPSSAFVLDDNDELSVYDDYEHVHGYLWATDTLVTRLREQVKDQLSEYEMQTMENINFYPALNVVSDHVSIEATFWTHKSDNDSLGSHNSVKDFPLSDEEKTVLRNAMQEFSQKHYRCSCLDFVNYLRAGEGMAPLKPALTNLISAAEKNSSPVEKSSDKALNNPQR